MIAVCITLFALWAISSLILARIIVALSSAPTTELVCACCGEHAELEAEDGVLLCADCYVELQYAGVEL